MRTHRTDLVSLAFGLIFLGIAVWWLVAQLVGFVAPAVGWFVAGALLLVGLLGLAGAVRAARSPKTGRTAPDGQTTPDGETPLDGSALPDVTVGQSLVDGRDAPPIGRDRALD